MAKSFIRFLGARGSMPVAGASVAEYGGNTSCVFLSLGDEAIILDAGSGLRKMSTELLANKRKIHILLSHTHIDHIIGLPFADILSCENLDIDIYGATRNGMTVREQIECLMRPPLWPVGFETFRANVTCHTLQDEFWLGKVHVRTMEAQHPGGCMMFRLSCEEKSVVYATDNELGKVTLAAFTEFAKGCTVLICDGQYSQEEYKCKVGYGHTGRDVAVQIALHSGCEQFVVFHHDPCSTDDLLRAVQAEISAQFSRGFLAKEDMEIEL